MLIFVHGLNPCGTIDMSDCGNPVTCRFFHRIYKEHERRIRGFLEPEPCILFKNNRGNRTKIFPVLDLVQSSLHSGIEGRGEYRTTSQGPGSKLHPPLKPTNNF